LLVCHYC